MAKTIPVHLADGSIFQAADMNEAFRVMQEQNAILAKAKQDAEDKLKAKQSGGDGKIRVEALRKGTTTTFKGETTERKGNLAIRQLTSSRMPVTLYPSQAIRLIEQWEEVRGAICREIVSDPNTLDWQSDEDRKHGLEVASKYASPEVSK